MVICCVVGCSNKSGGKSARQKEKEINAGRKISFHGFPSDKEIRQIWIDAVKREDWTPTQSSFVCSEHFAKDLYDSSPFYRKLKNSAIPTIFPTHCSTPLNPIKEELSDEPKSPEELMIEDQASSSGSLSPNQDQDPLSIKFEEHDYSLPISTTDKPLISKTTPISPDQQRTLPFIPDNYKFTMSVYRKKIKLLQQKTRRQARRIAKLENLLRELKRKN